MATVWLARDLKHDRPVALKVMHPELAAAAGSDRFLREIRVAARLQHPHILPVLDSGGVADPGGELLWYAMPYVEGESLRERLDRERELSTAAAVRIAREVADALEHAHRHGVVHRDIKPENILLSGDHALVADFGIARALDAAERLTATGVTLGTPLYMSPEQAAGDGNVGPRADIYSLGCVLYEMLAGAPPFAGPNAQSIIARRLSEPPPRLSTVRDTGPALEAIVMRTLARAPGDRFETASELAAALRGAEPASAPVTPRRFPVLVAMLAAAALVVLAWVGLRPAASPAGDLPTSVAVLPFVNLDPGGEQDWFSDGLSEELATRLSQVNGLRVAAHSSANRYRGRQTDVREVGRALGVGAVIEGSVRRSGRRLRASARLVDARDGYQLWAESYDRELTDVFAVQEEIARAIAEALRVELGVAADTALGTVATRDLEAYDLYLQGRFAWNERSAGGLQEAVRLLEEAVARDPAFARAWAALADAYVVLTLYADAERRAVWPKARAAAERALALDPSLVEAHTALAYGTMLYEWDWVAAEAGFRRAIGANANYATAHHWYADFLAGRGRLDEALREMERAHALDPLSRIIGAELGWVLYLQGRYAAARDRIDRTLRLDSAYPQAMLIQGLVAIAEQRHGEAIPWLERSIEIGGEFDPTTAALVAARHRAGDGDGARAVLAQIEQRAVRGDFSPLALSIAYIGVGDGDRAMAAMRRAVDERDVFVSEILFDPLLQPVRSHPEFEALERRLGLR